MPGIVTGIENPVVRGDLADRSIIIRLKPIAESERRTEAEVEAAFEKVRPLIFGALLEGLSEGLRRYKSVKLERLPRMADFCKWAVACEGAYWPAGTFMAAYDEAQASATEDVLEESPVGPALRPQILYVSLHLIWGTSTPRPCMVSAANVNRPLHVEGLAPYKPPERFLRGGP